MLCLVCCLSPPPNCSRRLHKSAEDFGFIALETGRRYQRPVRSGRMQAWSGEGSKPHRVVRATDPATRRRLPRFGGLGDSSRLRRPHSWTKTGFIAHEPADYWRALRDGAVFRALGGDYILTRGEDVRAALRNHATFASRGKQLAPSAAGVKSLPIPVPLPTTRPSRRASAEFCDPSSAPRRWTSCCPGAGAGVSAHRRGRGQRRV